MSIEGDVERHQRQEKTRGKASEMPYNAKHHASALATIVARARSLVIGCLLKNEPRRGSVVCYYRPTYLQLSDKSYIFV